MAWDKGFDFRQNAVFSGVTDPTDCTYALDSDTSPTTRNSVTFQWSVTGSAVDGRDRNNGNDPRLAGINFFGNGLGETATFTVTLPATGDYDIYAAFGDASGDQTIAAEWGDNGSYTTIANNVNTGAANSFIDAAGNLRTHAQWVADSARGGTARRVTMTTTTFQIRLAGLSSVAQNSAISHLFISQVGAAGQPSSKRGRGVPGMRLGGTTFGQGF